MDESEHNRTLGWPLSLKILKNTGVNSSNFLEANVTSPNGPNAPPTVDFFSRHSFSASYLSQLGSNGSALSKLGIEKTTSTSAYTKFSHISPPTYLTNLTNLTN